MFTGLIEKVGTLAERKTSSNGGRVTLRHGAWSESLNAGESVAVDGVCLTVASHDTETFSCDVLAETLTRTTLGEKHAGDTVNLERALRVGDRMGGHMVSGHVDGPGTVVSCNRAGGDIILSVRCERALLAGVVPKGSVACNGVSLTVAEVLTDGFTVHLIPTTLADTNLSDVRPGDHVNIELDMLGKFVQRHLEAQADTLTEDKLRRAGF